ncbi:MAG: DNA-directed RNA polymerase subunit K [Candidatus Thorarchaeota archaeon]|jgi:DNA-directed RNA polymerase subunit K/omega
MSEDPKVEVKEEEAAESPPEVTEAEKAEILTNIQGVGPKNAVKLVEKEYDTINKIAEADAEELAAAVSGFSVAKAVTIIDEAKALLELIEAGVVDLSGKKKSKRKKAQEPDPDRHDLPPSEEIEQAFERVSLTTGLETEKSGLGIHAGPKWLTKFEKARIIGARALQISMGAPVLVSTKNAPKGLFALAEVELSSGVLPMTLRRTLPTGESHDIPLKLLLKHTRLD